MRKWIHQFDYVRLLAITGVILIHAVEVNTLAGNAAGILSTAANALSRFAVPCFAIVAGYLSYQSLHGSNSTKDFYKNRFARLASAFIFWIPLYFYWWGFTGQSRDIENSLWSGMTNSHLWFVFAILGLYLLAPVFKNAIDRLNRSTGLFVGLLITVGLSIELIFRVANPEYNLIFATQFFRLIGFFYFGNYFARFGVPRLSGISSTALLLFSGLAFSGSVLWYRYVIGGPFPEYFLFEESLLGALFSYSVFLAIYTLVNPDDWWPRPARNLAGLVFGVYLLHPIILDGLTFLEINWLIIVDLTILISFLIVWLGRKSSLGKYILG